MENKEQLDPYSPGGCFIATACYGSELTEQVLFLKQFRDNFLADFSLGRKFIETYYKYSPPVADFICDRKWLRRATRLLLVEPAYLVSRSVSRFRKK